MFQIADGVFQIPVMPGQAINTYLVDDVLVDAGLWFSASMLLRRLQGHALAAHVLTHAHPDHQGASHRICTLRGVPLWCHRFEKPAVESGQVTASYRNPRGFYARYQQLLMAGPAHPVARTLADGDVVAGCEVIHAPGHTTGHIALWRPSDRLLIAGDAAIGMNLLTMRRALGLPVAAASVDMQIARRSIHKLAALGPLKVAFGHGPVASGADFQRFAASL